MLYVCYQFAPSEKLQSANEIIAVEIIYGLFISLIRKLLLVCREMQRRQTEWINDPNLKLGFFFPFPQGCEGKLAGLV